MKNASALRLHIDQLISTYADKDPALVRELVSMRALLDESGRRGTGEYALACLRVASWLKFIFDFLHH